MRDTTDQDPRERPAACDTPVSPDGEPAQDGSRLTLRIRKAEAAPIPPVIIAATLCT